MNRTLHFISLRHEGLPAYLAKCVNSWKAHHPGWTVRVWGRQDVQDFELKPWIDLCETHKSKAELMSYEIVCRFGGVFCALDIECVKSIDELMSGELGHALYLCNEGNDDSFCSNTWFAAPVPGNPLLKKLIHFIQTDEKLQLQLTHPPGHDVYDFVGPKLFARLQSLCTDNEKDGKLIMLPSHCFYPFGWYDTDLRDRQGPFPDSYGVCLWTEWWKA